MNILDQVHTKFYSYILLLNMAPIKYYDMVYSCFRVSHFF